MAAESLENKGKEIGHSIKVETQGQSGAQNILTEEEIKNAKAIIVAADVNVDLSRFNGKKVLKVGVSEGIHNPKKLIEKALKESFTCYTPIENDECWNCKACHRKYITFKIAGCEFDIETEKKCIDYIERNVLELIKNGTYGGGDIRGKQVLEIYNNFKKGDIND